MPKRSSDDDDEEEDTNIPLPIQTFLWRQTSPFIRPKFGKLQDATAMEQKEACKSLEKVLVQNIQFGLSPSLTEAIKSISRWRLTQAALPHVMHCCAALLFYRKNSNSDKLGASETKLLYTLHWILLDAAEECLDSESEKGKDIHPDHYLLPIPTVELFIYLFAPLISYLKQTDFLSSFRLENGYKIWDSLFQYRHPDIPSFVAKVKPKRHIIRASRFDKKNQSKFCDVFIDDKGSHPMSEVAKPLIQNPENGTSFDPVSAPQTNISPVLGSNEPATKPSTGSQKAFKSGKHESTEASAEAREKAKRGAILSDPSMATYLDVAVIRCLFTSQWLEEGVNWALRYVLKRLEDVKSHIASAKASKLRSSSLPIQHMEYSAFFSADKPYNVQSSNSEDDGLMFLNSEFPTVGFNELRRSSFTEDNSRNEEKQRASKRFKKCSIDFSDAPPTRSESFRLPSSKSSTKSKLRNSMFSSHELLPPPRPQSTLGFCETQTPKKESRWSKLRSDLVRGRSMPSLHLAFEKQNIAGSHDISPKAKELEVPEKSTGKKMLAHHTHSFPNPIITVTEHSPQASVQFFVNTDTNDSQKTDDQNSVSRGFRPGALSRSQTDSNITYSTDTNTEASGSLYYITKSGNVSLLVLLKSVHAVSMRDNICSLNVCSGIVDVTKMLVSLGLLQSFHLTDTFDIFSSPDDARTQRHRTKIQEFEEMNVYHLFIDTVMRVHRHLGCPHGCNDGHHVAPAEPIRNELQDILMAVFQASETQFSKYFADIIATKPLQETVDTFHAIFGFCCESSNSFSPMGCKLMKGPNNEFKTGYSNNFGSGFGKLSTRSVECIILQSVFKPLITEVVEVRKDMKTQENMSLYCDIRHFAAYVRDNHGGIFRKVALSGLLESAELLYKRYRQPPRVVKPVEPETEVKSIFPVPLFTIGDTDTEKPLSHRKSFFRKKTSNLGIRKVPSNQSIYDELHAADWGNYPNLPGIPHPSNASMLRISRAASPRLSITDEDAFIVQPKQGKVSGAKGGAFLSWLKGDKGSKQSENLHPDNFPENGAVSPLPFEGYPADRLGRRASFQTRTPKMSHKSSSHVSLTFLKARKRMEDQFKCVFGKGKSKQGSFDDNIDLSRRNSFDFEQVFREGDVISFKESKLVPLPCIKDGMLRFSFLLESCTPGTLPDPPLIAAMLTLKAPVVARAAFFFECASFIHACNRGNWPSWMKLNLPLFRPSMPSQAPSAIRGRNSQTLHRIAGRMFYQWAEAIGAYLELLLIEENAANEHNSAIFDDTKKRQLRQEDEEEDFLDEANISLAGTKCPYALKIAACQVLLEVTSFLRETHQYLPTRSSKASVRGEKNFTGYEPRTVTANRRWSMALSSLGFSQTSAHSLMSLAEPVHQFPHTGERRISFVLHEADGEGNSEHSSNTTITLPGEDHPTQDDLIKKNSKRNSQAAANSAKPHLLRRATGSGHGSGSFKRRSIKLKKAAERKKHRPSTCVDDEDDSGNTLIKRADSLRSRRKVSGISEKSDTSERADISGDESPGIMSDDGQVPDIPNDNLEAEDSEIVKNMPWLNVVANLVSSLNFGCIHTYCCNPMCFKRQIRACSRLVKAVKKVYKEEVAYVPENMMKTVDDKEDALKKEKKFKKILTGPSSPLRRKTSMGYNVDKHIDRDVHLTSHSLHSSTTLLPHLDVEAGLSAANDPRRDFQDIYRKGKCSTEVTNMTLNYMNHQTKNLFHCPISTLLKGTLVFSSNLFIRIMTFSWELILEADQHIACSAAVAFIVSAVKAPEFASELLNRELQSHDTVLRIKAINKFFVIWKSRYQCWPRMEEGAFLNFKIPPPTIEFTLPSPKIAMPHQPVADPPWMPQVKTKIEEVAINQEQSLQRSFVTATKTRRKQQIELVHKALQDEQDKLREEREIYRISSVPVVMEAAYEPILHRVEEHEELDEDQAAERPPTHHVQVSQAIFPSSLCTAAIQIINLLNDPQVSSNGCAIYEVAYKVVWYCLVEDTSLFLRHLFEKLTRENQKVIFQILRRLIRFMPRLPSQAAYTLYNYLIGFVMFYVRSPIEGSQDLIGATLSVLWLVIPSVHGLFLKDLKQVLRKEQCDATLLITANVPSTKKIIVHGPDVSGIPSQFPIHEDTQFSQIMIDSLDYFGIDESQMNEYFLVDSKTNQMHNLSAFVRDFYFFKRSQYPQLSLVKMDPNEAFDKLQNQAFTLQFVELGKVLMSLSIVKSQYLAIQRVLFLHEELMKLPSFPRKALEANFNLYNGSMGKEILGMDTLHKIVWVKLVGRMLEVTSGFFAQSSDIHLFLNVVNGALILHCEDAAMLRLCMATLLNAAYQFKNIFAINGYLLIMPTILRIYSNHQTNGLLCRTIQFVCKQFYIMHRKPFMLQLFGSAAPILDMDTASNFGDASRVQPKAFFQLLQSMSQYIVDPLDILELVEAEKPLKAWDFCYQMDPETLTILDAVSLCVTVIAYAADSQRGQQMLTILEACLPLFMKQMQTLTMKKETPGGPRAELQMIHSISVCMKTLISNSEALTRNFTGPQRAIDLRSSSIKNASKGACSPPYEIDEDSHSRFMGESYYPTRSKQQHSGDEDAEAVRIDFRRPRDAILNVVAEFLSRSTARLQDLSKKLPDLHQKGSSCELLDVKCHLRLAEIAHSLLKVAPYDPPTMACRGLVRYMNEILPNSEWRQEAMRPALIMILRRLDKMFNKIAKKGAIKRLTDWEAAKRLLKGVYSTFVKHPYIVHLPHLKSLISICQSIILGDQSNPVGGDSASVLPSWAAALAHSPPPGFCSVAVRLIAMQILQMSETQTLETICGGAFTSPEKTEIYLMNMIYPMCIRISGGLKNVPKLRPCDITFVLSVILNTLMPSVSKTGGKSAEAAAILSNPLLQNSLHQIGFLGLKIMMVCFERQLMNDWYRVARCIREMVNRNLGGVTLWNFLDFVVTNRTSLFILLLPLVRYKLLQKICDSDEEYFYQQLIKSKLEGKSMPLCRSKGQLLVYLLTELRSLKDDLVNKKTGNEDKNKSGHGHGHGVGHRLSYAFSSALQSGGGKQVTITSAAPSMQPIASTAVEDKKSTPKKPSLLRGFSFRAENRLPLRGLSVKLPSEREPGKKGFNRFVRRTSYPYNIEEGAIDKDSQPAEDPQGQSSSEPRLFRRSTLHIKKRGSKTSQSCSIDSGGNSAEGSNASLSGSPSDSDRQNKHRLQRQKAQSRKTFRFRKSRRGAGFLTKEDQDNPNADMGDEAFSGGFEKEESGMENRDVLEDIEERAASRCTKDSNECDDVKENTPLITNDQNSPKASALDEKSAE